MSAAIVTTRDLRAHRAAERWRETNDHHGAPFDELAHAVVEHAARLRRDLEPEEVDRVCRAAVAAYVDAEEQREAEEVRHGDAEAERLRYLERLRARLLLTRDESPRGRMVAADRGRR